MPAGYQIAMLGSRWPLCWLVESGSLNSTARIADNPAGCLDVAT
jgi:hypothetical protein